MGASLNLVDRRYASISISVCEIIGDVQQATVHDHLKTQIEFIKYLDVQGSHMNKLIAVENSTFDRLVIFDIVFKCKEFPIPDDAVEVKIVHTIGLNNNGNIAKENGNRVVMFVHMKNSFLRAELKQIQKDLYDDFDIPFSEIYLDLTVYERLSDGKCTNGLDALDDCMYDNAINYLNDNIGCSVKLKRYCLFIILPILPLKLHTQCNANKCSKREREGPHTAHYL